MHSNGNYGVGSTLGTEGIVRDITIKGNKFNKISSHAIWHEEATNSSKNPIFLDTGKPTYNINISDNDFYLIEGNAIDWGGISNRGGKFPYSIWSDNNLKYIGFDIEGNETTFYPDNGFNTHAAKQLIIENNIIDQIGANSGDGNGIILDFASNYTYVCEDVIVRNNIISGATRGATDNTSGVRVYRAINCLVYNNVCYKNKAGISVASQYSVNTKVFNNTCDNNVYGIYMGGTNTDYKNNIVSNNTYGLRLYSGSKYDYNLFYGNKEDYIGSAFGTHDVHGNPQYVNLSNADYRISSGSAAINKGIDLGLSVDILGNQIVNNPDIGAYEYSTGSTSSSPSAPSLSAPSNGENNISISPTLNWNASSKATSYTLQVSQNSNFTSFLYNQGGLTSTSQKLTNLNNNTTYFWRVSAKNSVGTSSWSSIYSFITGDIINPTPSPNIVTINTETGILSGDVHLKTQTGSLGSKVLYFLNTFSTAKYTIKLDQSGTWYAWGRMYFESTSGLNAFYIQIDNGSKLVFGNNSTFDKWLWNGDKLAKLSLGNLSAGTHTITIYGKEPASSVMLDQIALTMDAAYNPNSGSTGGGTGSSSSDITLDAESGILSGDVHLKSQSGSKGSKVVYFLNNYSTAKYTVNLQKSGIWYAFGRMFFESSSSLNSFFIQIDNGEKLIFGNSSSFDQWNWQGNNLAALSLGNLSSGNHTITIYGREPSPTVMLDQIALSSDASFNPNNGGSGSGDGSNNQNYTVYSAENGTLQGDAHLSIKSGSMSPKVVYFQNTSSTLSFSVNFNKSGTWYAWGRMYFDPIYNANSFYVQVDNGPKLTFGNNNNSYSKWHWEGNQLSALSIGNISAGTHKITIYGREARNTVMLDQILFTQDGAFSPDDDNITFAKSTPSNNIDAIPTNFNLAQNYPNPFNPSTKIQYSVPKDGLVAIKIYNVLGAEVASLVDEFKSAGTYEVTFNASNLSSGVYIYKIITTNFVNTKKMLLLK